MTVDEFIEKYKSDNFESYLKENATKDYWNDLIKTFKIDKLNFVFPDTLLLNLNNVLNENFNPFNVQFDGFCERQIKILEIKNQYQSIKNDVSYIDEVEKEQFFAEIVFEKGLYYYNDANKVRIQKKYKDLENNFETKKDFVKAVNSLLHANGLHFYSKLKTLTNETEFIKYIQSQYDLYNEYTPNNSLNWLNFTKKAIVYGFGILRIENDHLKALFVNWYNEILKTITPQKTHQDNEIDIYLKSYNENHFDEVMIKRNEDGTPNNIYLGNNFNEWLTNIDRNLSDNKSYDAETQDKLSIYNKYLLFLAQDLIGLYKAVSGYKKTNNTGFITSIHIQENKILQRLDSINYYSEIVKHYTRNKQFQKAKDIKDYCIALFGNCVYNLNDVLTIDICKSPLKTHFKNVITDLEKSINFEELKILNELSRSNYGDSLKDLNTSTLLNNENITLKGIYQPIVFTLKEYESIYECRLLEHLKIHIDYDINHFILEDISHYKFYISLIEFIGCVPDDMMNKKHKFPIINIADFDYNNLYFKGETIDDFFCISKKNDKGYVIIEEVRPDVMNVINLFKNLTFDEFIFKSYNLKNSFRLILNFLSKKKKENKLKIIGVQTNYKKDVIEEIEKQHPTFEPNLWNLDCFELFKYLYDCYYKDKNRQLTNIWFYLKECGIKKYNIKATKDTYKVFIFDNYGIKITNFDKAQIKWEDKERETIDEHRINFEDNLKQIEKHVKNT